VSGTEDRLFLDANVLFSAAHQDGTCRALLEFGRTAKARLLTSDYAWAEAQRNLALKNPASSDYLRREVRRLVTVVAPRARTRELSASLAEKDRPVLTAAITLDCTHLITGDRRHFGELLGTTVHGVQILTPRQYLEEASRDGTA
jgi:predicted nucleic acid-binding protein